MSAERVALVTGCSDGGIGWHLADALQRAGWRVFGTVRDLGKEGSLSNVRMIKMDVCDRKTIEAARDEIFSEIDRIDLLINNAGAGGKETLLEVPMDDVFGQRMAKQGSGIIVNVGSVAGIASVPWMGIYGATKSAVRSLTTTLGYELEPIGLRVIHLAPALIHTRFSQKHTSMEYNGDVYDKASLSSSEASTDVMVRTDNGRGMPAGHFAAKVVAILQRTPSSIPGEIIIGTDDWMFSYVHPWVPTWIWRRMLLSGCMPNGLKAAGSVAA